MANKTLDELSLCFLGNSSMRAEPEVLLIPSFLSVQDGDCLEFKEATMNELQERKFLWESLVGRCSSPPHKGL